MSRSSCRFCVAEHAIQLFEVAAQKRGLGGTQQQCLEQSARLVALVREQRQTAARVFEGRLKRPIPQRGARRGQIVVGHLIASVSVALERPAACVEMVGDEGRIVAVAIAVDQCVEVISRWISALRRSSRVP